MTPPDSSEPRVARGLAGNDPARSALSWMHRSHAEEELLVEIATQVQRHRRQRRRVWISGAAALVMLAAFSWPSPNSRDEPARVRTATAMVSAPESRSLPDGSIAELKDGAQIAVEYGESVRRVILLHGTAHFSVAKNPERQFIVVAHGIEVRAVGTAFAVQLGESAIEVLVTEGRVSVASGEARDSAPVLGEREPVGADAGQRVIVELARPGAPEIRAVADAEFTERLAWRIPNLEFSRTPLDEVIALMNEHGRARRNPRLELADAVLRDVQLTGFLRADNVEGLVHLLEANFGVKAAREGDTITLRKAR